MVEHDELVVALTPLIDILDRLAIASCRGTSTPCVWVRSWKAEMSVGSRRDGFFRTTSPVRAPGCSSSRGAAPTRSMTSG